MFTMNGVEPLLNYRRFRFTGVDGTSLLGWTNDADGPGAGVQRSWHPAGGMAEAAVRRAGLLGGGLEPPRRPGFRKPADPKRIGVPDHVDDAFALMDAMGWDSAVIVGWSIGVNVAFEMASQHPERVAGIVALAGVPSGTFEASFAPLLVPSRCAATWRWAWCQGPPAGRPLTALARAVPKGRTFADVLRWSGFAMPHADPEHAVPWIQAFLEHDFQWYFSLGVAASEHQALDPSFIEVPVTIAAAAST